MFKKVTKSRWVPDAVGPIVIQVKNASKFSIVEKKYYYKTDYSYKLECITSSIVIQVNWLLVNSTTQFYAIGLTRLAACTVQLK